jgi:hypothetical protein
MTKLRRFIRNWLMAEKVEKERSYNVATAVPYDCNPGSISFNIRGARGGWVVETNQYNQKSDRHISELYVLTDYETLGTELAKILSLESLKQ